jgi:hypothetical protein
MRKELIRRLERQERKVLAMKPGGIFCVEDIGPKELEMLAANEHIVEDWYLLADDEILFVRERITADPSDSGVNYRRTDSESEDFKVDEIRLQRNAKTVGRKHYKWVVVLESRKAILELGGKTSARPVKELKADHELLDDDEKEAA